MRCPISQCFYISTFSYKAVILFLCFIPVVYPVTNKSIVSITFSFFFVLLLICRESFSVRLMEQIKIMLDLSVILWQTRILIWSPSETMYDTNIIYGTLPYPPPPHPPPPTISNRETCDFNSLFIFEFARKHLFCTIIKLKLLAFVWYDPK